MRFNRLTNDDLLRLVQLIELDERLSARGGQLFTVEEITALRASIVGEIEYLRKDLRFRVDMLALQNVSRETSGAA